MLEEEQGPQSVKHSRVQRLTAMGFKEKAARIALKASGNSIDGALERLQVGWRCSGAGINGWRLVCCMCCVCCVFCMRAECPGTGAASDAAPFW
jgi:hypothetical protein